MTRAGVCEYCRKYLDRLPNRGLVARSTGSIYCDKNNGGYHRISDTTLKHWTYIGVCPRCNVDIYRRNESWKVANFNGDVLCTEPATGIGYHTHVVDPLYQPTTTETESIITMDKVVYNPYTAVVTNPSTGDVVLVLEPFTATGSIHARDHVVFALAKTGEFDAADLANVDIAVRPF